MPATPVMDCMQRLVLQLTWDLLKEILSHCSLTYNYRSPYQSVQHARYSCHGLHPGPLLVLYFTWDTMEVCLDKVVLVQVCRYRRYINTRSKLKRICQNTLSYYLKCSF